MKKLFIIFFVLVCVWSLSAQTSTKLPVNIANWKGQDSDKILKNATVKSRLKKLLGKKNYADFLESWETLNPISKKGNFLFSSGCLIHACGHAESAIAIDLGTKTIHVGIFREGERTRFFNEKRRSTPKVISSWARRLIANSKE